MPTNFTNIVDTRNICDQLPGIETEVRHVHRDQPGPLSFVEECRGLALIGRECCWRQLSYAIKDQFVIF